MKKISKFIYFLILPHIFLNGIAVNIFAQQKFDITTYKLGTGWKKENTVNNNALQLTKTNATTGGYCLISIGKSVATNSKALENYKTLWQTTVTQTFNAEIPKDADITTEKLNDGRTFISGASEFTEAGKDNVIVFVTSSSATNTVPILLVTNSNEYQKEMETFLKTLKFEKTNAISMPEKNNSVKVEMTQTSVVKNNFSLNGFDIVGLWQILTYDYVNKNTIFKHQAFFANGQTIASCPSNGFYEYNGKLDKNVTLRKYSFENNKGLISDAFNSNYGTSSLEMLDNNKIKIGSETYFKCQTVDGAKLQGTYTADDYLEGNNMPNGTKTIIHFDKNGKFIDEGFWAHAMRFNEPYKPIDAPGKGTYEIKEFTIFMTYEDGHKKTVAFNFSLNTTLANHKMIFIDQRKLQKIK
jgi:hypothetical protein